jgi:proteasome beta subunit
MLLKNAESARRALFAPLPTSSGRTVGTEGKTRNYRGRHGTTIFAFHYADGLILAGDRQVSDGYSDICSTDMVKIEQISDNSALMSCGLVSSGQFVEDALKVHCRSFEEMTGYLLSTRGQVRVASSIARTGDGEFWDWSFGGILAGLDAGDVYRIFAIDTDGSRELRTSFTTDGSGYRVARTVLDLFWRKDLTRAQALRLAAQAMFFAGKWDTFTSDARLMLPSVAAITTDGFAFVTEEELRPCVNDVNAKSGR